MVDSKNDNVLEESSSETDSEDSDEELDPRIQVSTWLFFILPMYVQIVFKMRPIDYILFASNKLCNKNLKSNLKSVLILILTTIIYKNKFWFLSQLYINKQKQGGKF